MRNQIKILMSGVSKINRDGIFKAHRNPYYQLNHIMRGTFDYVIDGHTYSVSAGDTVLVPMNSMHSITQTAGDEGYYFEVKFSTFSPRDKEICDGADIVVPGDTFSPELMREIFRETEHASTESDTVKTTYLYAILYYISAAARQKEGAPSKYIEVGAYSEPVRNAIRFLEDNYAKHLTIGEIVAHSAMKKSTLCSRFKQETTMTIFECLMVIRIRKAVELLSFTEASLAEISKATGFASVTHFSRVFAKHVMIPPGQYRRHLASQNLYWIDAEKASSIAFAVLENTKINVETLTATSL